MRRSWRYLRDVVVSRVWNPPAIEREPAAGPFTAALRDLRFRCLEPQRQSEAATFHSLHECFRCDVNPDGDRTTKWASVVGLNPRKAAGRSPATVRAYPDPRALSCNAQGGHLVHFGAEAPTYAYR